MSLEFDLNLYLKSVSLGLEIVFSRRTACVSKRFGGLESAIILIIYTHQTHSPFLADKWSGRKSFRALRYSLQELVRAASKSPRISLPATLVIGFHAGVLLISGDEVVVVVMVSTPLGVVLVAVVVVVVVLAILTVDMLACDSTLSSLKKRWIGFRIVQK